MAKIGFAGAMQSSVAAANAVKPYLEACRHTVHILQPIPQPARTPWTDDVMNSILDCNLVVLGAASFPDERVSENKLAALLTERRVPFVVLGDTPESVYRVDVGGWVKNKAFSIILATDDYEDARAVGWKRPVYLGLPPHLEASYLAMSAGVDIRFTAIKDTLRLDTIDDVPILLYPGTKDFSQDARILRSLIRAGRTIIGEYVVIGYRPHPTLKNDPAGANIDALFDGVWRLEYGNATLPQTIASSTITVFAGLSSELLSSAHANVGGVYVSDEVSRLRNGLQGAIDGIPEVVRCGAFPHATSLEDLPRALAEACKDASGLRERRSRIFPKPKLGSAHRIALFLNDLV